MAGELVLLTGGTGFLGYTILVDLLKSGYRVRVAARSQSKIDQVLAAPSISALNPPATQLSFVIVPDMMATGAYDNAVQGVDFIIHAAAPVHSKKDGAAPSGEQLEEVFVTTAMKGNLGILQSAAANGGSTGSVKRIVMTSSTVAIAPANVFFTDTEEGKILRGPETRIGVPAPPYHSEIQAYCVSKTAALNASEAFMRDNTGTLGFDLISIIPSCIFGIDELSTDTREMRSDSTKMLVNGLLTGNQILAGAGNAVLCADVARAHVRALDPDIVGNQSFILNTDATWEDTVPIAQKYFPEAFASGLFRVGNTKPTIPLKWDSSKVCARSLSVKCLKLFW